MSRAEGRSLGQRSPRHLTSITAALVVTVGACMWLGYLAHKAAEDHRVAVESTYLDYTGMGARELAHLSGEAVHWLLDATLDDRRWRRFTVPADYDYSDLVIKTLDRRGCHCPAMIPLKVGFRVSSDVAEIGSVAGAAAGVVPWLVRELDLRPEGVTHGLLIPESDSPFGEPVAIWYSSERSQEDEPPTIDGFVSSLEGVGQLVRSWYESKRTLPGSARRTLPDDSLFFASLRAPDGRVLFETSPVPPPASTTASFDTVSAEWGGFEVFVDIRQTAAHPSGVGGLPPSRSPLFLVILGLVLLLGVGGVYQYRREMALAELRDDFVSSASHELRTPLTQIRLFAELQRSGGLTSEAQRQRAVDVIEREARHLTHLIENILHFNGAPRVVPPPRALSLNAAVDEVCDGLRLLLEANDIEIEINVEPDLQVLVGEGAVERILTNLIDNAVKYGPVGQTIRVTGARGEGGVVIGVEDQGPGVPEKERENVWHRYLRLDRDIQGPQSGTGVGLAVVAQLASENAGRAWVEDGPGGGARFAFLLPEAAKDGEA